VGTETPDAGPFGLCADCRHAERIRSNKGSVFLLCGLSRTDPRFPKYPRLPVLACDGYRKTAAPPPAVR
jgi:hypothetical protein